MAEESASIFQECLGDVGRVVALKSEDDGWEAHIQPWEEIRLRRRRRLRGPVAVYEIRVDSNLKVTSCLGGEEALRERLTHRLQAALERRVKEPLQKIREIEEVIEKPRVTPAELEKEYLEAKRREEWEKAPSFLENGSLELILFGGKGGVGKTTSSASTALYLARSNPQKKILAVSTDPAHSLGDSFDCPLGGEIMPIKGIDNLWGLEVDARALMEDYKRKHEVAIKKITDRGTLLDEQDINEFFELTLPGLDEMMAIIQMADILKEGLFDLIIMDTAPTGHTLRLLSLPAKMHRWGEVLDDMQAKHRYMSKVFTGKYRKDDADAFTEMVKDDVDRVNALFKDKQATEFVPVMIPEPMSIAETERLVNTLEDYNIMVKNVIINRMAGKEDCPFCQSRQRDQEDHLPRIKELFGSYNLIRMPLFPREIRGIDGLSQYAEVLSGNSYQYKKAAYSKPSSKASKGAKMSDLLKGDFQLLVFGGKGGVGKTTSAASTALTLAKQNPKKKVLIFSTDPAHSLCDSFDQPIGDKVTQIEGVANLYAIEVDAEKLWADFVKVFKLDVIGAFDKVQKKRSGNRMGGDVVFEKEVMLEMIDVSPSGVDEIMALEHVIDLMNENAYDLFILDTAPTGHLLRLLEMPDLTRDWLKTLFRALLKYQRVVPLTYLENLNRRLIKLSKGARRVLDTLMNPQICEVVAVGIPEAMSVLEMEDLLFTIKELGIPCRHIIINKIIPPTNCGFCATKREEQQRYIEQVKKEKFPDRLVTEVGLFPHQIRGLQGLNGYAKQIF